MVVDFLNFVDFAEKLLKKKTKKKNWERLQNVLKFSFTQCLNFYAFIGFYQV